MKIFGIGLSKTGTNSLTQALEMMGYKIAHYPPPDMFEVLATDKLDGCTDIPTALRYKTLDKKFPGSKFILTMRDRDTWLESVKDHFKRRPASTLNEWGKKNRKELYGGLTADKCDFSAVFDAHHADVYEYFDGRDDMLVLDLEATYKWEDLCHFLGQVAVEENIVPYPVANEKPESSKTVDAVYPYAEAGESWDELRYSIRSVAENFLDLRDIWVVGDQPAWLVNANIMPKTREYSEEDVIKNIDYTQSILWAAINPKISDPFLVINDDHYMLAPMTAQHIEERMMVREDMSVYSLDERNTADREWQLAIWNQYDRMRALGLGGWNFECHTPVLVTKAQIIQTWAFFGYGDGALIWKTAYFNMFPPKSTSASLSESSGHKAGIYEPLPYHEIKEKGDAAIYLNHNDDGMNHNLQRYIHERFPNPSIYEVEDPEDKPAE